MKTWSTPHVLRVYSLIRTEVKRQHIHTMMRRHRIDAEDVSQTVMLLAVHRKPGVLDGVPGYKHATIIARAVRDVVVDTARKIVRRREEPIEDVHLDHRWRPDVMHERHEAERRARRATARIGRTLSPVERGALRVVSIGVPLGVEAERHGVTTTTIARARQAAAQLMEVAS